MKLADTIEHLLLIGMGVALFYNFLSLAAWDGRTLIYEHNSWILWSEVIGCASIVVFGIVRYIWSLRNKGEQ